MFNLFAYTNYKKFIKDQVGEKRGRLSLLAAASNCQASYLSRVLRSKVQITMDQTFKMCRFFKFDESEAEYFTLLVEWDRAADPDYRNHLQKKLKEIRICKTNIQKEIRRATSDIALTDVQYHSHWAYLAIHVLTNTGYNTLPLLVAKTKLPETFVKTVLDFLAEHNLVYEKHGKYSYNSRASHLPSGSPVLPIFHNQWRQRATLESVSRHGDNQHFTNVQSISKQDYILLERKLLDFSKSANTLALESESEEVFVFTCDLFKL